MRKGFLLALVLFLCAAPWAQPAFALPLSSSGQGQSATSPQTGDKTAPSYDLKGQALLDIQDLQKKFVDLASAIPPEKFTWRPADGVRSFSELFLHISAANYGYPNAMGVSPPAGADPKTLEKSTTDKAQIIEQLNKSFVHARSAVEAMANADFAKPLKKLGPDANYGDVVYLMVTHAHEHLGQAIAYARENGVVPPWTAAAAAARKKSAAPQE